MSIAKPGDSFVVESPGYYGIYTILDLLNLKAIEVLCNLQSGLSIPALTEILNSGENVSWIPVFLRNLLNKRYWTLQFSFSIISFAFMASMARIFIS